mmetsp:Transcript_3394/g.8074  ORF Transcript_3394/g.8074 Transcript_3394/m.8074 type:complete len:225 (+) Transcript_3394:267-941(+)
MLCVRPAPPPNVSSAPSTGTARPRECQGRVCPRAGESPEEPHTRTPGRVSAFARQIQCPSKGMRRNGGKGCTSRTRKRYDTRNHGHEFFARGTPATRSATPRAKLVGREHVESYRYGDETGALPSVSMGSQGLCDASVANRHGGHQTDAPSKTKTGEPTRPTTAATGAGNCQNLGPPPAQRGSRIVRGFASPRIAERTANRGHGDQHGSPMSRNCSAPSDSLDL